MFDEPEIRNKRFVLIMMGALLGAILGYVILREPLEGMYIGNMTGAVIAFIKYPISTPRDPEQKKMMRERMWTFSVFIIMFVAFYGYMTNNIVSSIGVGIGLLFSVGTSVNSMYDERIGNIFNKAARDALIFITMSMSVVALMNEAMWMLFPTLMNLLGRNPLISLLWVSYALFAFSWLYNYYYTGE